MLIKKYVKSCAVMAIVTLMIINPQLLIQSVKNGMIICYNNVIPSLYIFMVLANYRAQPDIMEVLSFPLRWYGKLMKIEDSYFAGSLVVALLGGFAVGASYLKILQQRGYSENTLKSLSPALINNSFAFCVFATGAGQLGSVSAGLIIYISLIAASLITAFILSFYYEYNIVTAQKTQYKIDISMVNSIRKAVESIMVICGFVIVFNLMCEALSLYTTSNTALSLFFVIFSEITCGILKILSVCGKNIYLLCFALSILPISTLCQVYYFTDNTAILKTLILSRLIHTPVSLLILSVLANLFPVSVMVSSNVVPIIQPVSESMEISSVLFMITIVFIMIFDKNKLFTKGE